MNDRRSDNSTTPDTIAMLESLVDRDAGQFMLSDDTVNALTDMLNTTGPVTEQQREACERVRKALERMKEINAARGKSA